MDWVVRYDYPIDNEEETKMETVFIRDLYFDKLAVDVKASSNSEKLSFGGGSVIQIGFDWQDDVDYPSSMRYSPEQARELALAIIKAADEVESNGTNC